MTRNTFSKHNESALIYEKNGLIITNYNTSIIQLESKPVARPIIHYITTK
jgi:hypothetical protein